MNKGLHSKSHLKFFAYTFVLITSLFTFISCENFLQGEEVKEEITKAIEYNNAQAYTINVEALDGSGKIKTPAACEVTKKVTDVFTIRFEPAEDHKFIKWEAIVKGMSTGEKASDYIEFENSESQETKVTLKKGSNQVIEIRPVCPPRLTYTFTQGAGDLYPRDTAIELNFNQKLSNCNLNTTPISYITIPNLDEGEDSEKYFKAPVVTDQKIIFRAETKEGTNFIPVPNNSRSVQVRIPKDEVWYVNKDYSEPIEVYLDSDIVVSYLIGTSTSAKTKVKYLVTEKNGQPLGTLKVNGNDNISEGSYSVGETISLRYWIPEGYSFNKWKFMDSKGEEYQAKDLSLTLSEQDSENNPIQLTFTIENQVKDEITIKPEIYDPIVIKFKKDADDTGTFKAGTTQLSLEEQNLEYAIGNEFTLSYKVPAGYFFYGWEYNSIGKKTEIITKDEIKNLGIDIVYDKDGDENGYDKATRLATAQITIDGYTDKVISIKPVSFPNLEVTKFKLDNADNLYERDSDIVFTFNKTLSAACKDFYTIRIPGLPDGKTAADYFESAVLNGNTLTIKPKKATSSQIIPLLTDGTNTITVSLNAEKLYYETKTSDGTKVNVGLDSDKTYTYKINSETKEKTKIKVQLDPVYSYGTIKVNGVTRDNETVAYSIGNTVSVTYNLSKEYVTDYYFENWQLVRTYTNAAGVSNTEDIDLSDEENLKKLNIQFSSEIVGTTNDIPIYGATILIDDCIDGIITIQPKLGYIEDVSVIISGSHGKFSPSKGPMLYKLGQKNHVEFEPDSDYAFIRWQFTMKSKNEIDLPEDESVNIYDYIRVNENDFYNEKFDFEVIKNSLKTIEDENDVELDIEFELQPVIAERPQIISNTPLYSADGVLRDTTIQVMFDYDMDDSSIYYTNDELKELAKQGISGSSLRSTKVGDDVRYYGYEKGAETYFKNISIVNSVNNENLVGNFKAPVFENPRKLSIPISESLTAGLNVMVTLDKDFFRLEEGKEVAMSQAKKWLYLVNGNIDNEHPTLTKISIIDDSSKEITAKTTAPVISPSDFDKLQYVKSGKLKLALKVHDNTAPDSSFILNLDKLYDSSYETNTTVSSISKSIDYSVCYGTDAVFGKEDNNIIEPIDYELTNLTDGLYSLSFTAKDRSGNPLTIPAEGKYYFCLDTSAPNIDAPIIKDSDSNATSLILNWSSSGIVDYKGAVVKHRIWDSSDTFNLSELITETSYTISDLIPGTHYEIIIQYYDYAGNVKEVAVENGAYTRPDTPENVSMSSTNGYHLTVTGTKSDNGNFTNMRIRYSSNNGSTFAEYPNRITTDTNSQTLVLSKGYTYLLEVCSYDSESGKYSIPYYKTGTTLPSFVTIPSSVTVTADFDQYTNKGIVSWAIGSGNYSGYFVYCSTISTFPESDATKKVKITSNTTTKQTFENLTPGTYYYCKVEPYYIEETNKSVSNIKDTYTKCEAPKNLTCTSVSNSRIDLSWQKPSGNFNSYKLEYKKHSATEYTSVTLNTASTEYSLTGLSGGDTYDFKLTTVGVTSGMNNCIEKSDIKTCPNPVRNFSAVKVSASDTGYTYTVTWTAPVSGNYDGYKLYIANSVSALSSATPISYNKSNESSGVVTLNRSTTSALLYLKVETYLGSLKTESSPVCCSLALDAVKNLSVVPYSSTSIKLSWTNLASTAYDGIRIYMDGSSTPETTITSKSTSSYTQTGLSPNTKHSFTVTTYKNDSATSTEFKAEALGSCYTYSTPVTVMTAEATGPKTVKLTWTKPKSAEWYQLYIYRDGSKIDWWAPSHTNTYSYDVSAGGTSYTYKIVTLNAAGVLNESAAISKTLTTPPESVSNLALYSNTSSSITLTWTKPGGNYTGIKIYKKLHSESSYPSSAYTTVNNTSTSATITGLTAGASYDFKLETYLTNVSNVGETSQASLTNVYTKPYAPTGFSLYSRTPTSMSFSWTKLTGTYAGLVLKYKKSTETSYTSVYPSKTATSYTINNLSPGTAYNVYLASYNPNEDSDTYLATTSTLTKATPLATPTNFSVYNDGDGTKASWTAPTNASTSTTTYYLYYRQSSGSWSYKTTTNTYYKFGNTDLNNGKNYEFYVSAYSSVNSEGLTSASTSTVSCYTPPAALSFNSLPVIYTDDAMGTITLHWVNTTGRSDIGGIYLYIGNTFLATISFSNGATVNKVIKIPNYTRGGTYTFKFVPYYSSAKGPEYTRSLTTSSGPLKVNGYAFSYTALKNVLTSTYKIYWNSSTDNNLPGKDVNSTSFNKNVGKSYAFWKDRTSVTMSPYSIGAYEVTQALYEEVMGGNSSNWKSSYNPVSNVNWYQAIAFCNKLSVMQGLTPCYKNSSYSDSYWLNVTHDSYPTNYQISYDFTANGYHLPTECQWELAGHGGKKGATDWNYKYPGSDGDRSPIAHAGGKSSYTTVGSLGASCLGLYDMVGNVREWTSDWWSGENNRTTGNLVDPAYSWYTSWATESLGIIVKGCDYTSKGTSDGSIDSKCWGLQALTPSTADKKTGFRLCRNVTY